MSNVKLIQYDIDYYDQWNNFIDESENGTLFHKLDFLEYHGDKFSQNEHHLIWLKGKTILAVMPFAIFNQNDGTKIGKSPFGASFGGIIYRRNLNLKYALRIYDAFNDFILNEGLDNIKITPTPLYYYKTPNEYLDFILSKGQFGIESRDIFNVVPIEDSFETVWENFEGRARTTIRKYRDNFDVELDVSVDQFYPILKEDKIRHDNATPTHTLTELEYLKRKFPEQVFFDIATHKESNAKAGICYFLCNPQVMMTFYMAQEDKAVGENGVNILLESGFKRAIKKKVKYLDFGGSSIGYTIENPGVAMFKESFGAIGRIRNTYIYK